jgi:hypothetical protein
MRYPRFAQKLRQHGTPAEIVKRFGFSRRQTFEYLAGRNLPRAEKILQHPDLVQAAQADIAEALNLRPEPLAA